MNKARKIFIISTSILAGIIAALCMCAFDSDFQVYLIAPAVLSLGWLALVGYANREFLMEGED